MHTKYIYNIEQRYYYYLGGSGGGIRPFCSSTGTVPVVCGVFLDVGRSGFLLPGLELTGGFGLTRGLLFTGGLALVGGLVLTGGRGLLIGALCTCPFETFPEGVGASCWVLTSPAFEGLTEVRGLGLISALVSALGGVGVPGDFSSEEADWETRSSFRRAPRDGTGGEKSSTGTDTDLLD